jgi:hypothetical protein
LNKLVLVFVIGCVISIGLLGFSLRVIQPYFNQVDLLVSTPLFYVFAGSAASFVAFLTVGLKSFFKANRKVENSRLSSVSDGSTGDSVEVEQTHEVKETVLPDCFVVPVGTRILPEHGEPIDLTELTGPALIWPAKIKAPVEPSPVKLVDALLNRKVEKREREYFKPCE